VGEPVITSQFLDLGSRAAVDQTLSRLARSGKLARLTRGVYVRAKINRFVGPVLPNPMQVAEAVGRATGSVVGVGGTEAARQLGLSTQVPAKPVFYTTGPSRRFELGKTEVRLKHIAQRKLAFAGSPAGLALTALWYLGKTEVTPDIVASIAEKLPETEFELLRNARNIMPAWMADAFRKYEQRLSIG